MRASTIWLTGLSGSGKSTFAKALKQKLDIASLPCVILDGDVMRAGLCSDLAYSQEDRAENNRRIAEVAKILNGSGIYVICALISPMKKDRDYAKSIIGEANFNEVYLSAPLDICERRDPKGLYRKARKNEIKEFTGVSAPYEEPESPVLSIPCSWTPEEASCVAYQKIIAINIDINL